MPMIPVKEAIKGVPIAEPEIKEHQVDLLIVGGGMGACGVAYEAVRWGDKHGLKILLCRQSRAGALGAVAQASRPSTPTLATTAPTTMCAWSVPTSWVWCAKT